MEGQPHLLDSEILEYESLSNINNSDISSDEDDNSDDDVGPRFSQQPTSGRTNGIRRTPALLTSTPTSNGKLTRGRNVMEISEDDDD